MLKHVPKSKDFFSQHPKITKPQPKITLTRKEEDVFTVYNQSIENYFNSVKKKHCSIFTIGYRSSRENY